ncbi:hypothetical protein [Agrobacterium tumefaciens]|uniref:hypothetical protein n=1 Tax=Agrobacterium tumefaciens TaxID=358 RepID=UPI001573913F|nr:hypothetical protein [Agrobacterium tumefaciens]
MARRPVSNGDEVAEVSTRRVETQRPWGGRRNYTINSDTVLQDAYRLLNVVLADEAIARLATEDGDVLISLRDQFVENELIHLLIGTAVMNRSQDDHMAGPRNDADEMSFSPVTQSCGRLTNDVGGTREQEIDLNLREGCNKIIHAEHITVETQQIEDTAFPSLPATVILRGRQGRNVWVAHLNVPDYVRATIMNFRNF